MKKAKLAQEILEEIELDEKNRKKFIKKPFRVKITRKEVNYFRKKEAKEKKELSKKLREEKRIINKKKDNKKRNSFYNKNKVKFFNKTKKFKKSFFNSFDSGDRFLFKKFFSSILFNGLFINFAIYCVYVSRFGTRFTWWTFIGFGIILWYIENNLLKFIKEIKRKSLIK